jgi:hypothetical protein
MAQKSTAKDPNKSKGDASKDTPSFTPIAWPGAFALYTHSRDVVRFNLWVVVIFFILGLLFNGLDRVLTDGAYGASILTNLIVIFLNLGITVTVLAALDGRKLDLSDSLSQAFPMYLKYLAVTIVLTVISVVSFLLLIIPFFFVFPRIVLAPYYLVDQKLGIIESLQTSWRTSKDNFNKVWGIVGVNILFVLLMFTIVGIPFAIYFLLMYQGAFPLLYKYTVRANQ